MAGLLDLFSGRSSDIYGEGLLSPEQRGGLGNIGLLALAGKLGQLAGPSFSPVPDFGAALGQAAGAYGASQEGAGTAALNAILTGQKGRKLQQELEFGKQIPGTLAEIMKIMGGLGSGGGEGSGSTGGGAVAPAGAGGGGGDVSDPLALIEKYESGGRNIMQGVVPPGGGYNPSVGRVTGPSSAGGYWQIIDPTWRENAPKVGVDLAKYPTAISAPREVQKAVAQKLYDEQGFAPWAPYNPALAAAIRAGGGGRAAAAPTAAAPTPAGGGGLLNLPQVPQFSRDQFGLPQGGGNAPTVPSQQLLDRARRDFGEGAGGATPGQGAALEEPPGFAGRQLVAQLGARPPLGDVSQYRQVAGPGGGEPGGGMVSGLLAPGGPLTRGGVPGLPAMPPAAAPSADPSLQLGPLAPAPAAAAPAAAGPGLLAPPGAPAAAALPRGANPAYGNVSNLLGILGVQAEAAGLKNVFAPLADAFRQSPAFQAQLEREKARVGVEFAGPKTTAEEEAKSRFVGPNAAATAAAQDPYIRGQAQAKSDLDLRNDLLKQGVVRNADGSLRQATEEELAALTAKDRATPTTELKDYAGYVKDQGMRNQPALSFFDWSLANKRAGAATTEVKIGEHAGEKMIDLGIKSMEAAEEGAKAARSRTQQYAQIAQAAQNFVTGPTAEGWLTVKSYLKDAGIIKGTDVPDGEVLRLAARRLEIAAAPKGQGSITDFERGMLREAIAGMATSPEGLARAIVIGKRLDDYDIQVAQIHRDVARANKNTPDYLEVQDRIAKLGPPLSPQERQALEALQPEKGAAAGAPGAATAPPGTPPGSIRTPYGTITPRQ